MKFAIMGDTHFDFYFRTDKVVSDAKFDAKFKAIIESNLADVLIIAGDIGHYNTQNITCLRHLKRYYKHIVVTFGNHDYYLVSKAIASRYQYIVGLNGSRERVEEMKTMIDQEIGIDYVDGNVIEIDGIRIGGATGWYDGSLLLNEGWNRKEIQTVWVDVSNDAHMIEPSAKNGSYFETLFYEQKHHLDAVYKECDIMVTHVSPLSEEDQFLEMYDESANSNRAFYCFDGEEYLENGTMIHWIFGHTHRNFNRTYQRADGKEIQIICNSIGRPKDKENFTMKVIEVVK